MNGLLRGREPQGAAGLRRLQINRIGSEESQCCDCQPQGAQVVIYRQSISAPLHLQDEKRIVRAGGLGVSMKARTGVRKVCGCREW